MIFRTDFDACPVNFVTVVRIFFILFILLSCFTLQAQEDIPDTIRQEAVVVKGFETARPLLATAAPVFVATQKDINRYANTSMVNVVNQAPGVRMEERSPGSYRLSVRGSLLRSPFGVRNIKVYLAGIPFTDAGGNTYVNLLDVNMISHLEILKGPSGITYGAGTGGTLLLNEPAAFNPAAATHQVRASVTGGSYNTFGEHASYRKNSKKNSFNIQQSHFQSDGYREHSSLRRDAVLLHNTFSQNKSNRWDVFVMYGNLHYETPGGITLQQMEANPKLSRQRAGAIPSAIEQQIGIYQQTIFTGISNKQDIGKYWSSNTSVFFAYTDFANPFITNYETRFEKSGGMRSVLNHNHPSEKFNLNIGVEAAKTGSQVTNFGNRGGTKDTLQNKDNINATQGFAFAQAQLYIAPALIVDAGVSLNHFSYDYERVYPATNEGKRKFKLQLLPRVSLLYRVNQSFSLYSSVSRGYSPPAIAEVRPDNQVLNTTLQPEAGTNVETGFRGYLWPSLYGGKLYVDVSAYHFRLKNTIVRRSDLSGDFFVNAGSTKQEGIELYLNGSLFKKRNAELKLLASITLNKYRFDDYKIVNTVFDGNRITGVPDKIYTLGADIVVKGWYLNATATYTSSIPLTDDNSIVAESFYLLNARTGYRFMVKKMSVDLFITGNNLLDELYSPGNDLNAMGRRYYNPGAKRNFVGGVMIKL